jgi:hypothetical protein
LLRKRIAYRYAVGVLQVLIMSKENKTKAKRDATNLYKLEDIIKDIVINLQGKSLKDAKIESIKVGGALKYQKSKGKSTNGLGGLKERL